MSGGPSAAQPRSAVIVGAGIVGMSTAWFLQDRGVEVTLVDRGDGADGASTGNAGWLAPALSGPLPGPGVLRFGLHSLLDRRAPLHVPARLDPRLWSFLAGFAAQCSRRAWQRAMRAYLPLNAECLEAYEVLASAGVDAAITEAPVTAVFRDHAASRELFRELHAVRRTGQRTDFTVLDEDALHAALPQASEHVVAGIRLDGQRYLDPGAFLRSLARAVVARGATMRRHFEVRRLLRGEHRVAVQSESERTVAADVVVLAIGARLPRLGRPWGVRTPVRAGRGYAFTVPTDEPVPGPIHLPTARVGCTPCRGGLRVAGTMELRDADAPLDRRRIEAMIDSARPLLRGVRWEERTDEWSGPSAMSRDGLPLIGATNTPGIYVAAGHGMWGQTLGPVTGRLLAERITTGKLSDALRPFDPQR